MLLKNKKVLILTGGGETQTLNATIYGAIIQARKYNMEIFGGICGWKSLLDNGKIVNLTNKNINGIENIGGTFLRTSRTNPFQIKNGIEKLKKNQYDFILAIGGDDTLWVAKKIFEKFDIKIVAAPKTADNDLNGTYFTPGFPSAAKNLIEFTNEIKRDCAIPRHRLFLIETQGGHAGWLSSSAILGNADLITVPEKTIPLNHFLKKVKEIYDKNKRSGVIVVSKETKFDKISGKIEQQNDSFKIKRHENIVIKLKKVIQKELKIETQTISPGNFLRSGKPYELDKKLSIELGKRSIELINQKKFGFMSSIEFKDNKLIVSEINLKDVVGENKYKKLPDNFFDFENLVPTKEFYSYIEPILKEHELKDKWYYDLLHEIYE
jgi:ATP-dependent phosphofructokinase / diphosphate-dependent phosphofructokinase